jgi:5-methylcytosine-specific restriction protein A
MPRAPRRCPAKGCTALIRGARYCDEHLPKWEESEWQRPAGWEAMRRAVLDRDGGICWVCGGKGADTVHHLRSKGHAGRDDPRHMVAIHDRTPPHCHRAVTNRDRWGRTVGGKPG